MRFKPVPEPPANLKELAAIRAAVPAAPDEEIDCCARLIDRTDVADRGEAATWLTFLRALELATETSTGFARTSRDPELSALRTAFRERVDGANEALEAADRPLEAREIDSRLRERPDADESLERTKRLLEWAALLEIVDREGNAYRLE